MYISYTHEVLIQNIFCLLKYFYKDFIILYISSDIVEAQEPWRNTFEEHQPVRASHDLVQLPDGQGGRGHVGEGHQVCDGHGRDRFFPPARQPPARRTVPQLPDLAAAFGRLLGMHGPALHRVHIPPSGYSQDGSRGGQDRRGGPKAPGVRRLRTPCGGRVRHAYTGRRQHQRAGHNDRREGRGHDQGNMA